MADRCLDEIDSEIKEVHGRTFRKLGSLLIEIVDRKLFQLKGFTNVEDYFNSEAHLPSARQAFRLISATRFSRQLPDTLPQPKSERQVRPLLGRPIEEAKLLWAITAKIASERKCAVDGKLVSKVVKEYQDGKLESYAVKVEALLNGTKSIYDDHNSMEQEDFLQSNPISLSMRTRNEPESPTLDKTHNRRLPREQQRLQQSPPAQPMACPIPRTSNRIRSQPRSNPTNWCFPCAGRPHSALSQVSSSDNACSCGLGSGNCRVLGMAEQLSTVVSMLAQSWGCSDVPPESDPMGPSTSREPPGTGSPPSKAGKVMCCSRMGYRALQGGGGKIGKVDRGRGQSQEGEQQQCEVHEEQLFKVLQKSYLQLMMLAQRMGMGMGADQSTGAFHWPYWPQAWPADPSGTSADWRQWYNLPDNTPNNEKDAINMFNGPYGAYMTPPVFSHGMSMSPAPLLPGASNPFGIDSMPNVGDDGGILPSFLQDGFPFPATTPSEGPESPAHYSQDEDDGQIEVGDLLLGSPGPQSLCSGRKRERSTDRSRSQEVSPPVRHGKMVRFSTPEKKKTTLKLQPPQHREPDERGKRTASSRRIDEIAVAEVLVCMSHQ